MTKPVYTLGNTDPITFHSFAGADLKVYKMPTNSSIDDILKSPKDYEGSIAEGKEQIECQAFSFAEKACKGTLVYVCLDGNFPPLSKEPYHLLVIANDEYGNQSTMALKFVNEVERTFGISIDDTVMEYNIDIEFGDVVLWRRTI